MRVDGQASLQHARSRIEVLIDEMHGTAMLRITGLENTFMRVQAGIRGQQGRVDVEYPTLVMLHEPRAQNTHIAGEDE